MLLVALAALGLAANTRGSREIIVGGEEVPVGRYPYMAGLLSSQNGVPYCGGALVSPWVAYTAAHC